MPTLIFSDAPLTDAQARSAAPAYSSVLQSLGGRVRALAELVQGREAIANENPGTPFNPQGLIGVDFSGPPFGSAWRHTVFARGGVKPDVAGDCVGQKQVGTVSASNPVETVIEYHSRGFPKVPDGPYSRIYLAFRAYRVTGGTFDLTVSLGKEGSQVMRSSTVSITTATETSFAPLDVYWDIVPHPEPLLLRFEVSAAASSVGIAGFSGYQRVKQTH